MSWEQNFFSAFVKKYGVEFKIVKKTDISLRDKKIYPITLFEIRLNEMTQLLLSYTNPSELLEQY